FRAEEDVEREAVTGPTRQKADPTAEALHAIGRPRLGPDALCRDIESDHPGPDLDPGAGSCGLISETRSKAPRSMTQVSPSGPAGEPLSRVEPRRPPADDEDVGLRHFLDHSPCLRSRRSKSRLSAGLRSVLCRHCAELRQRPLAVSRRDTTAKGLEIGPEGFPLQHPRTHDTHLRMAGREQ